MTPLSPWEIYLACATEDARSAGALYDALCKSGARVFWRQRDVAPGEDERADMERALEGARIGVFALSRATSSSMDMRSDVAAAIARFRDDPTRRVIPVHCDDTPKGKALYGTNILKELSVAAEGGEAAVATRILELLRRYRAQERIRPRIAVVAVTEELSAAQDAAVALLRRLALKPEVSPWLVGTVDAPGVLLSESWEGVVSFLFGVHAERGRERAEAYVERLLRHGQERLGPVPARRRGRILGVAARCIAENPKTETAPALRDELWMEIAQRFAEEGATWPLSDRLLALEALGRLGDPRLDSDPWVDIEGGTFTVGGDSEAFQSLPAQEVTVA